ncbi:MAG: hypothetical protein IPO36_14190 [Anaerolineales bacterium]|nr:hypothetical protein [Anaerolineales bacterium]
MQKIKASHDIEVEAKQSSDLSKLSDVFINDPRFPLNTDRLEFTKSVTNNPSLETAGYLDFKMAYIENGFDPNGFPNNHPMQYVIRHIAIIQGKIKCVSSGFPVQYRRHNGFL